MPIDEHVWQRSLLATLGVAGSAGAWSRLGRSAASATWSLTVSRTRYFVKVVSGSDDRVLSAEAEALGTIAATGAIRVPRVLARDRAHGCEYLVLEWLDLADGGRDASLGAALARMHAVTSPHFGWHRDNTIGATPQVNGWSDDWAAFFRDRRLRVQFALAARNGYRELARAGEALIERVPALLADHRPRASLLHGDLWSGNAARLRDGSPAIYDPALYYGDAETDLAMTALFGGFDASFHEAYASVAPLADGHARRRTLYNLYHVLNHVNLFGGAYAGQAKRMIEALL